MNAYIGCEAQKSARKVIHPTRAQYIMSSKAIQAEYISMNYIYSLFICSFVEFGNL